eukprot:EG_transcript_2593
MVFGSTVTTLTRPEEDCIHATLPLGSPLDVEEPGDIKKAVRALRRVKELRPFLDPKVSLPYMVRLKAPMGSPVDCTLGVGTVGVQGSHWIRRYVLQSNVVRPLLQLVDCWDRAWGAGMGACHGGGRFDRHALQLMVLFFLCHEGIVPYLPPKAVDLASLPPFPEFLSFAARPVPWPYVLQMLAHFFRFYAQWPADRVVALSEPPTAVVTREAKGWQQYPLCVEIPHRPTLNLTKDVTEQGWQRLQASFDTAASVTDVALLFRRPAAPSSPAKKTSRSSRKRTPTEVSPAVEAPPANTPSLDTPSVETPSVEAPSVETPSTTSTNTTPASEDPSPTTPPTAGIAATHHTFRRLFSPAAAPPAAVLHRFYAQQLLPSEEDDAKRKGCFQELQRRVATISKDGDVELKMFGSTVTMLCTKATDLDVAAIIRPPPRFQGEAIAFLKRIQRAVADLQSVALIEARIPILKKADAPNGFPYNFDISCQGDGVVNSHWLRRYVAEYPVFRPLALLVKEWSKAWGVNNGPRGRLNSYTLNLMLIYFLCHEKVIDYIPPTAADVSTLEAYPPFLHFTPQGVKWSLVHELLRRFFAFFALWPAGRVVCLSASPLAGPLDAKAKLWHTYAFAVEDPFILDFNVALNIRPGTWAKIQVLFTDASRCCAGNIEQLFTPQPFDDEGAEPPVSTSRRRRGIRAGAAPTSPQNDAGQATSLTADPPTDQQANRPSEPSTIPPR